MKKILFLLLLAVSSYGQTLQNPTFGTVTTKNSANVVSPNTVVVQDANGLQGKASVNVLPLSTATINALKLKADLSTGLIKNGLISINADPTKFNISAGVGIISNFSDPDNPVSTIINFPTFTGVTPTYLTTGNITYIAINSTPAIVMQASPFTASQRRDLIVLGAVVHSNLTNINVVNNIDAPSNAVGNQLHDFIEAVGALNITGNKYSANGANLSLNKSAGTIFKLGVNFANDWKNPHQLAQSAGTSITFRYRTQNGAEGSDRTTLDPTTYDLNNVLTAVPNNKFIIETVVMFQSGLTRVLKGQNVYDDMATALAAISTRDFVIEPNSKENGIVRAYIVMKSNSTSLLNASDTRIVEAQKFGGVASGGVALTFANIVSALGFTPENTTNKQNSLTVDGTGAKFPTVDAINSGVILTNTNPQTKIGSLTLGQNISHSSDNWIALGTSVTHDNAYTVPMGAQLGLIVNNFGVSGSTSNNLASQYANIPTLNVGNIDNYRLLSIEHGINDAAQSVPLATYRANLENCIANAKGKGWTNNKILIINSNYCTSVSVPGLQAYADEAILIAKEQGVQYVDIYNYTKNNGGGSLLLDGIHPSTEGGKIYARGVTSGMYGGLEVTNALSSVNGINSFGNIVTEKKLTVGDQAKAHQLKIFHTAGEALSSLPALGSSSEKFIYTNADVYGLVGDVINTGVSYFQSQRTDGTVSSFPLSLQPKGGNIYFGTSTSIGSEKFQFSGNARFSSDSYFNGVRIGRGASSIISNTTLGINGLVNTDATSVDNTSVGAGVLALGVTIARNTGVGSGALAKTTGNSNTAVGAYALYENTSGGGNLGLGYQAGAYLLNGTTPNSTPNSSVYLGRETKSFAAGQTNELVVGYQANGNGSNTATFGNNSITQTYLKGNVNLVGLTFTPAPPTSAGGFHFLTVNNVSNATEKVLSSTVALTSDVPNFGVKTYTALIDQSGTSNPTVTVLGTNTIGAIVWTRSTNGFYFGNLTGAFPAGKTFFTITPSSSTASYAIFRNTSDQIVIRTQDNSTVPFTDADGKLFNNSIRIEVYP